ncbi:MAG: efflux RND transporter permease subunit, partial [Pseudomonadales bacterium]|nr:efflux RND transporter permease subunit [Pseudomonadales bacterium]
YVQRVLANYPDITYTLEGEAREQRDSTSSLGVSLVALLFFIYCMLALPLRSYFLPVVVMSVIPFALVGAVLGHVIMGHDMTMLSYMGLLALVGVVVNDSLVLVDFFNLARSEGESYEEAVRHAGVKRFRAVMLTSLTTFFGLLPMMFATSTQSLFLVPMSISLGFGILFATGITLILVPVMLTIAKDIKLAAVSVLHGQPSSGANASP